MLATSIARRDAAMRSHAPLVRPQQWAAFYDLRAQGFVPVGGIVRIAMSSGLTLGAAMEIPSDADPWTLDLSPVAGLDTFIIFDGERERYTRLRDVVGAVLAHNPASLEAWDAPPNFEPRRAVLKIAELPATLRREATHG